MFACNVLLWSKTSPTGMVSSISVGFLLGLGNFITSSAYSSLFVYHGARGIVYLLLYVDDMVIKVNNQSILYILIVRLAWESSMKDFGNLHYFLRIEITRSDKEFFFSQAKYALDLLTQTNMVNWKPISPFLMGSHLTESGMLFLMLLKFGHLLEFCNIWHIPRLIYLTVLILYVNKCMLLLLITSMHWIVFCNMLRAPIVMGYDSHKIRLCLVILMQIGRMPFYPVFYNRLCCLFWSKSRLLLFKKANKSHSRKILCSCLCCSWTFTGYFSFFVSFTSHSSFFRNCYAITIRSKHIDIHHHFVRELVARWVINL